MPFQGSVADSVSAKIVDGVTNLAASVEARSQTPTANNALQVQIGPGDVISNIPVFTDFDHHQIHEGETFYAESVQSSLGSNTVKFAVTVATYAETVRGPHMIVEADVYNGAALVQIYEGATFTGGTPITAYNRNRNVLTAAGSSVTGGVTSTNGTLLQSFYTGSGSKAAGDTRAMAEWVLKSNTIYRVDVIGQAAGTAAVVSFNWYEDLGV